MRRLGVVVRVAEGKVVVRSDDGSRPGIGETAVDDRLEAVGTVVDVMGPTDRPYAVVDPDNDPAASLIDRRLYLR